MFKWLKKIFSSGSAPSMAVIEDVDASDRAAILCAPLYENDQITRVLSSWVHNVDVPDGVGCYRLEGGKVSKTELSQVLNETKGKKITKIFAGHGLANALLGPPQPDQAAVDLNGDNHAVIYTADMSHPGPSTLYAFCCNAGEELGVEFCSVPDRSFLGYRGELPIDFDNEECIAAWSNIFQIIASEIVRDGVIVSAHEGLLKSLYHEAYLYFSDGAGSENDRSLLMVLYLDTHRDSICRYGGTPNVPNAKSVPR